ncbi:MAG: cyclase family protein [Magnetococcus sp. YQC-9]
MSHRLIDLTMDIAEGMQTFPAHWHPFVEITQMGRHGIENRETRKLVLGTHTGTHMDAPRHFVPGGVTVEAIPLEQLVGEAVLLDFHAVAPLTEIGVEGIEQALAGRTPERVIVRFGWDRMLGTMAYYTDHPYLSKEACRWLVERGCRLIALDTPMPDNPKNGARSVEDSPNHKIFLGSGVVIVEYLVNTMAIRAPVVELIVAPLKIRSGDGAPVRCFVRE